MKLGPRSWGIGLFGAVVALAVSAKDHPASGWSAEWTAAEEAVQLKSPGRNLMISTVWSAGNCTAVGRGQVGAQADAVRCVATACGGTGPCDGAADARRALMKPAH